MNPSGFVRVEGPLRAFFARCCDELSAHQADRMDRFIRRCFREPRPRIQSLENLQYNDYCRILRDNLRVDAPPGRTIRLFDRHEVSPSLVPDVRYCTELRNKYAHLKGTEDVSPREQFSDLVIVRRAVGELSRLRNGSDDSRALMKSLDVCLNELIIMLSESSAELASAKGARIEQPHLSDVLTLLHELERRLLTRLGSIDERLDQLPEALAQLAELPDAGDSEASRAVEVMLDRLSELLSSDVEARHRTLELKPISPDEARENLMALRKRIWAETGSGPSGDGLLRKSNLEAFLECRPRTEEDARAGPMKLDLRAVAPDQRRYLEEVIAIVRRIERN